MLLEMKVLIVYCLFGDHLDLFGVTGWSRTWLQSYTTLNAVHVDL